MSDFNYLNEQISSFADTWECKCTQEEKCYIHSTETLNKKKTYYTRTLQTEDSENKFIDINILQISSVIRNFHIKEDVEIKIPIKVIDNSTIYSKNLQYIVTNIKLIDNVNSEVIYDIICSDFYGLIITFKNEVSRFNSLQFSVFNCLDQNITVPQNYVIGWIIFKYVKNESMYLKL